MEDLKAVIAGNIIQLRKKHGMTQAELAKKLNYTDKAVSKWERHESLPDITVLKAVADCFGVTVDYLITEVHEEKNEPAAGQAAAQNYVGMKNKGFITGMSIMLVWLIACIAFVAINYVDNDSEVHWLAFTYAVPVSMIVWLVLNSVWFDSHRNFLIISLMMWGMLLSVFLTLLVGGHCLPLIFILGIPGQVIIFLWSKIRRGK